MATYKGNRNNNPSSITIVDDSAPPNATNFNTPIEGNADAIAWTQARLLASSAQNWLPAFSESVGFGPQVAAWNDCAPGSGVSAQRWIFVSRIPATPAFRVEYATGQEASAGLNQLGSNITTAHNVPPTCVTFDPATGQVLVGFADSTGGTANIWAFAIGGPWSGYVTNSVTACTDVQVVVLGGSTVILAAGSSTGGAAVMGQVNPGSHQTAVSGVTTAAWILKSNGTVAVAIAKVAGASTVYRSADGITWVTASLAGIVGVSDVPIDLAWSPTLQQWLLAVSVTGGATSKFFTSPDGQTFTATGTTLSSAASVTSLAAIGPLYVAEIQVDANTGGVIFTFDGVTWYGTGGQIVQNNGVVPRIVAGPTQFAQFGASPAADTVDRNQIRFSHCVGLPDQVVT